MNTSDALLSSEAVKRAGLTSLVVNICLVLIKGFAGIASGSRALVADAVHSLSDLSTDIAIVVGVKFWYRPPDESHPMGHRGIETAVSMFIGVMLVMAGAGIGYDSIKSLDRSTASAPGLTAAAAALLSVVSKEVLYRWTLKKSREFRSAALEANALHNRSDAFSSIPVLVAIAASIVSPGLAFLDSIAGAVVSVFVVVSGVRVLKPGISQMTNTAASSELVERIRETVLEVDGVKGLHKLRARMQAGGIYVDLHLQIQGDTSVMKAFLTSKEVERNILALEPSIRDVIARIEPWAPCGDADGCGGKG